MNWFACVLLMAVFDEAPVVLKPAPETPQIHLPTIPVLVEPDVIDDEPQPPKPRPDRSPKPITTISDEQLYVIESTIPLIVLASPDGFVSIESEEGPQKVKAKFVDGTGKMETRVFHSKHLYFINAVKPGKLELIIVPVGVEKPENILRQELTVLGQMPNPPPEPDPDPGPMPDPVPTSDKLLIEVVEDPLNRSPDTAIVLSALAEWNALKDKGHDWRIYSIRTTETLGIDAVKEAKDTPLPAMVIRDKESRKVLRVVNLPKTMADVKRILSELTGGI